MLLHLTIDSDLTDIYLNEMFEIFTLSVLLITRLQRESKAKLGNRPYFLIQVILSICTHIPQTQQCGHPAEFMCLVALLIF